VTSLNLVVEGQTEETFVRDVLRPYLAARGVTCRARCVETARKHGKIYRGGLTDYSKLKRDLMRWIREDRRPEAYFSTMIDLYAIPADFPGYEEADSARSDLERALRLEKRLHQDINHERARFIPYIQVHEFEALLFADPEAFQTRFPRKQKQVEALVRIRERFGTPEHIDNELPPSKRILAELRSYEKVIDGPTIAGRIGMERLRRECPHFNDWIERLAALPGRGGSNPALGSF